MFTSDPEGHPVPRLGSFAEPFAVALTGDQKGGGSADVSLNECGSSAPQHGRSTL